MTALAVDEMLRVCATLRHEDKGDYASALEGLAQFMCQGATLRQIQAWLMRTRQTLVPIGAAIEYVKATWYHKCDTRLKFAHFKPSAVPFADLKYRVDHEDGPWL